MRVQALALAALLVSGIAPASAQSVTCLAEVQREGVPQIGGHFIRGLILRHHGNLLTRGNVARLRVGRNPGVDRRSEGAVAHGGIRESLRRFSAGSRGSRLARPLHQRAMAM